ncbi:hypothetical protein [Pleurochrysis sp. endemic virus 2]|nr:hypothetical protein [Pleurochrysis sp. endemic virus 2]
MSVMLPREHRSTKLITMSCCQWCADRRERKELFKLRDGPIDWYFCNALHAELWLEFKQHPKTYTLCRMLPAQKREYLQGSSMQDKISSLFPERCNTEQQL